MVYVRMGEYHAFDRGRITGEFSPVLQSQRFITLKQTAIDQHAARVMFDQIFGTGHRSGGTEEL